MATTARGAKRLSAGAPPARNFLYAQSGGVTAVINATAYGVISAAAAAGGRVYAGKNGILGALREELCETWRENSADLRALARTPGGAFGSCRHKLPNPQDDMRPYARLRDVFAAHDIGHFLYNGGNDSADTALKVSAAMEKLNAPINCVGIPKTIDNDLPLTDCCPGFGSVAKYVAVSAAETMLDVAAMSRSSTQVFVLEVMGRHTGWIAAAAGLASEAGGPMVIVFPETPFNQPAFLAAVRQRVNSRGFAIVVAAEGAKDSSGEFLSSGGGADSFAHQQLGGVAPLLAGIVQRQLKYKCHWAVADYLQRSARHIASATDRKQAEAVGRAAVKLARAGRNGVMPVIWRVSDSPYRWALGEAPLAKVANRERKMPLSYLSKDKFFISAACRRYLAPLVVGEDYPQYANGLPRYAQLQNRLAAKKLPPYEA